MYRALALLSELTESDIEWILEVGVELQVIANTIIINEGAYPDSLYIVLSGLVGIHIYLVDNKQLATLGPGELLGEISFLENRPASATVVAVENSLLLTVPRKNLEAKLEEDLAFGLRLYKSFAIISAGRLRERVGTLGRLLHNKRDARSSAAHSWRRISEAIDEFKTLMHRIDQDAMKNNNVVLPEQTEQAQIMMSSFCEFLNTEIGDRSEQEIHVREELGKLVQREFLPYILLGRTTERSYSKPRGYGGDFLTIEWIYQNRPRGSGRLGPLIDRIYLNRSGCVAVRNRRDLLAEEIVGVLEQNPGRSARITGLACGPGRELFDVFSQIDDPTRLKATLIDIDLQALAFVSNEQDKHKLRRQINLVPANLVYLATGKQKLDLENQDLVYSMGLIDYFKDKFVVMLLNCVYDLLRPGGKVILGNFHPKNPDKAMLDYIMDWKLIHRTEEDLHRLYSLSRFGRPCTNIRFEPVGINLFAECVKT